MRSVSDVYTPKGTHEIVDADPSEHYEKWGYSIGYEKNAAGLDVPAGGNTAVFSIEPGGSTEPVFVTKPDKGAEFRVQVLSGRGALTLAEADYSGVAFTTMEEGSEIIIKPGQAYAYRNIDMTEELILHDEAMPAFRPGDDIELTSSLLKNGQDLKIRFGESAFISSQQVIYLPSMFYNAIGNEISGRY